MKILLVSSSILPLSGGSSVIVESLAQNFKREELTVFGSSTWRPKPVEGRHSSKPQFIYFFSEIYFMGRGNRYFRWFRKLRLKKLYRSLEKFIIQNKVTHVIGVYPNIEYCLAACRVAKKVGLPFYAYFHNTYIENTEINDPEALAWQQEIFNASKSIFVMSKGMQSYYEEKYKLNKFIPLVHTFNDYPNSESLTGVPGSEKQVYNLVAIGNFNESNLEATKRFLSAIKNNPKYRLSIYTHVPKILMDKRGLDSTQYDHMGAVAPDQVHDVIQQYDICILTHGFTGGYGDVEYKTIFPTRTIPLLLSGKPILVHSPKGSFLNQFVIENECGCLVDSPQEEGVIAGLEKVANDVQYQKQLVEKAKETAKLFYGPQVADELKRQLMSNS